MSFRIVLLRGRSRVVTERPGERLLLGRGTNADLRFDDTAVALEHAVLDRDTAEGEDGEARPGHWVITDRGSVTGTWVNGRKVDSLRLADGDLVEVGGASLRVRLPAAGSPDAPVVLEVRGPTEAVLEEATEPALPSAEGQAARAAQEAAERAVEPSVDHVAAYRLTQGWLAKPVVALGAIALTLAILLLLTATGRTTAFRPGEVSPAHASVIGDRGCAACHAPWQGAVDDRCIDCHESHPVHQASQVSSPPCGGCHTEHRRDLALTGVPDGRCVDCHGNLRVKDGFERRFHPRITDFGTDHPELAIPVETVDGEEGEVRRLRLSEPAAATADPGTVPFSHAEHLKPGLVTAEGRVSLTCSDCHTVSSPSPGAPGDGHTRPIEYEQHCQRCHLLNFEVAFADNAVPHLEPLLVRSYLVGEYSGDQRWRNLDVEERLRLVRDGRAPRGGQDAFEAAVRAEADLYQRTCDPCHVVTRTAGSLPVIAPAAIPGDWLPHARFPHPRHQLDLACEHCHAGAADSEQAADVLLPSITVCRECHGEGRREPSGELAVAAEGTLERVSSNCVDCHGYHQEEPSLAVAARQASRNRSPQRAEAEGGRS